MRGYASNCGFWLIAMLSRGAADRRVLQSPRTQAPGGMGVTQNRNGFCRFKSVANP